MRVLVVGATGLIGGRLVELLTAAGHAVVPGLRSVDQARVRWPGREAVWIDYADRGMRSRWPHVLQGIDAVVNAVGIFSESASQTFETLHVAGPRALFEAAAARGIRVVQISALGARPDSPALYLSSKGRADESLLANSGPHTVVMPSLVFSPDGVSTRWFALLAALPITPLPGGGEQLVQPVHLDDLCEAIVRLLEMDDPPRRLPAVGPEAVPLRSYIASLKKALGLPGFVTGVPMGLARAAAERLQRFGSLLTPESLLMLQMGSAGDPHPFAGVLGRAPRPVGEFVSPRERETMRLRAQLGWLLPLLRYAVALMWLITACVSAFVYPVEASLGLLARTGVHGTPALLALYGAAALDALLGLMLFVSRFRRLAYTLQLMLIAFYTLVISIALPEYWAHPYGPVLKNLPLFAAIALLHQLDDAHGTADR